MTLPAAGRHRVCRPRGAGAWALVLGATCVSVLRSREDPELDALDRLQLLGSSIISRRLERRWPNEPSMGIGQAVGAVVARPILWGDAVRALLLVGGDQRTSVLRIPWAFNASLYLSHRSACLEIGSTLPPFLIHSASETIFRSPRNTSKATRIA